jgi:hypothetical protein
MYRVMWGPENIDNISRVYDGLNDPDREQLMVAIESLDALLASEPMSVGESRDSPFVRVAIKRPLTVTFRVDDQERVVRISGVNYRKNK